jgi:hypothetical protein
VNANDSDRRDVIAVGALLGFDTVRGRGLCAPV